MPEQKKGGRGALLLPDALYLCREEGGEGVGAQKATCLGRRKEGGGCRFRVGTALALR